MKRSIIAVLASALMALPAIAQTYVAQSGVTLGTGVNATATYVSAPIRLPEYTGTGVLNITGVGITGSPSGCTVALAYQQNNAISTSAAVSSTAFTPAVSVQQFNVTPSVLHGDSYVATYACSSTYPTAGTLNISFSPSTTATLDPCLTSPKSSVAVSIATATTTSLVAVTTGKAVYACGFAATVGASSTISFEYGTGASCTGTHALTGVFAPATAAEVLLPLAGTYFSAPASNGICAVSTGTGGINGVLEFVQQ